VLEIALPHVDAWNSWYAEYGNTASGWAAENETVDAICRRVGRDPTTLRRSACVLVAMEDHPRERSYETEAVPVARLRSHLDALAGAGADEAILVLDPITEQSVRAVAERIS
jgi:hypothetical protein